MVNEETRQRESKLLEALNLAGFANKSNATIKRNLAVVKTAVFSPEHLAETQGKVYAVLYKELGVGKVSSSYDPKTGELGIVYRFSRAKKGVKGATGCGPSLTRSYRGSPFLEDEQ